MDDLLIEGVRSLHDGPKGTTLKNLTTGLKFRALVAVNPPIDPNTDLGSDPRPKGMIEVMIGRATVSMNQIMLDMETGKKWMLVYQDNNPADIIDRWIGVQVVDQKDN